MCSIGDDGTSSLAALVPRGSSLAAQLAPLMCTIGDPGMVALATLASGDLGFAPDGSGPSDGDGTTPDGPSHQIPPLADADPNPDVTGLVPLAGGGRPQFKPPSGSTPTDSPTDDPHRDPPRKPPFQTFAPFVPGFPTNPGPTTEPPTDGPLAVTANPIEVPEPSTLMIIAASYTVLLGARHHRSTRGQARKA